MCALFSTQVGLVTRVTPTHLKRTSLLSNHHAKYHLRLVLSHLTSLYLFQECTREHQSNLK